MTHWNCHDNMTSDTQYTWTIRQLTMDALILPFPMRINFQYFLLLMRPEWPDLNANIRVWMDHQITVNPGEEVNKILDFFMQVKDELVFTRKCTQLKWMLEGSFSIFWQSNTHRKFWITTNETWMLPLMGLALTVIAESNYIKGCKQPVSGGYYGKSLMTRIHHSLISQIVHDRDEMWRCVM